MQDCPLCKGCGEIPENKIHFGDSQPRMTTCPVCKGIGQVDIEPTHKQRITIIKPHGVWQSQN